jgi:hypothetical protein
MEFANSTPDKLYQKMPVSTKHSYKQVTDKMQAILTPSSLLNSSHHVSHCESQSDVPAMALIVAG